MTWSAERSETESKQREIEEARWREETAQQLAANSACSHQVKSKEVVYSRYREEDIPDVTTKEVQARNPFYPDIRRGTSTPGTRHQCFKRTARGDFEI